MIEVKDISKSYRIIKKDPGLKGAIKALFVHNYIIKKAVKNISFVIPKGEIVGYIGTNGAGKSTTIKMMTGILTPDTGKIVVNGIEPHKKRMANARKIGAVFGQRSQLSWDIPVKESYILLKKIYNIDDLTFKANLDYLTQTLSLTDILHLPIRQMSLGQKMRCELAAAFLHNPDVVYLDEPTIGLDVDVKDKIRKFIKQINIEKKVTIVLTTHDMQDIEELCERIIIIDNGIILYDGSMSNLKKKINEKTICFELIEIPKDSINLDIECITEVNNHLFKVTYNTNNYSSKQVIEKVLKKLNVRDITIKETSIENIVQKIYRKEITL